MSRHRGLRFLDTDDYADAYDDDDRDGEDDDYGGEAGNGQEADEGHSGFVFIDSDPKCVAAFRAVRNVVPYSSDREIKETLEYYALDVPKSINWLLDQEGEEPARPEPVQKAPVPANDSDDSGLSCSTGEESASKHSSSIMSDSSKQAIPLSSATNTILGDVSSLEPIKAPALSSIGAVPNLSSMIPSISSSAPLSSIGAVPSLSSMMHSTFQPSPAVLFSSSATVQNLSSLISNPSNFPDNNNSSGNNNNRNNSSNNNSGSLLGAVPSLASIGAVPHMNSSNNDGGSLLGTVPSLASFGAVPSLSSMISSPSPLLSLTLPGTEAKQNLPTPSLASLLASSSSHSTKEAPSFSSIGMVPSLSSILSSSIPSSTSTNLGSLGTVVPLSSMLQPSSTTALNQSSSVSVPTKDGSHDRSAPSLSSFLASSSIPFSGAALSSGTHVESIAPLCSFLSPTSLSVLGTGHAPTSMNSSGSYAMQENKQLSALTSKTPLVSDGEAHQLISEKASLSSDKKPIFAPPSSSSSSIFNDMNSTSTIYRSFNNLLAAPSSLAKFLCDASSSDLCLIHPPDETITQKLHALMRKRFAILTLPDGVDQPISPFDFRDPSPDDLVRNARQLGVTNQLLAREQSILPTSSSPSRPSTIPSASSSSFSQSEKQRPVKQLRIVSSKNHPVPKNDIAENTPVVSAAAAAKPVAKSSVVSVKNATASSPLPKAVSNAKLGSAASSSSLQGSSTNLAKNGSSSSVASASESSPKLSAKSIDILAEYAKRQSAKVSMNLVVVGHVDAGKSTLMGHLLYLLGEVSEKVMKKYERDSEKIGKSSFAYAWVLDETEEERNRGVTIDVAVNKFETTNRQFTLMDAPGHRDFIPNMISGAAQADVAILVVDATKGEFEAGFDANGQTKEHSLLVRSLGVQQLVVAINKLDTTGWSQNRYQEIQDRLMVFLTKTAGFKDKNVRFVPCSGLTGENLIQRDEDELKKWYSGPTLVECIDEFSPPTREIEKPLRLAVTDFYKGAGTNVVLVGKIESGNLQIKDKVLLMPLNVVAIVKDIDFNEEDVKWAVAGDHVRVSVANLDLSHLSLGNVLCSISAPIPVASRIRAQIVVFDINIPIIRGTSVLFHYQSLSEQAHISKLESLMNKSSGEVIKKAPRALPKNSSGMVEIITARPVCIETYRDSKELGRFMLRSGGVTLAAGIMMEILASPSEN